MAITIFSISLIAFNDLGGSVNIDGNLLNFSILIGHDVEHDFTTPSSLGFATTTARNWQDTWGGKTTLKFPTPEDNKLIISLEDVPTADKRFYLRIRTEDNVINFTHITSEWNYQIPTADVNICLDGEIRNIKQLAWSTTTQMDTQIKYLPPCDKVPLVIVETEPGVKNVSKAETWSQIITGTEEKCENSPKEVIAEVRLYKENPCRITTWTKILRGTEEKCGDQ